VGILSIQKDVVSEAKGRHRAKDVKVVMDEKVRRRKLGVETPSPDTSLVIDGRTAAASDKASERSTFDHVTTSAPPAIPTRPTTTTTALASAFVASHSSSFYSSKSLFASPQAHCR